MIGRLEIARSANTILECQPSLSRFGLDPQSVLEAREPSHIVDCIVSLKLDDATRFSSLQYRELTKLLDINQCEFGLGVRKAGLRTRRIGLFDLCGWSRGHSIFFSARRADGSS